MSRLYELSGQFRDLQERAEAGDDVSEALSAVTGDIEQKAAAMVRLMRDMDLDVDKIDEELRRLQARKKAIQNNCARLTDYLRSNMEAAGITKIKAGTFSICLSDGSDKVEVTDDSFLPPEFFRVRREVDKAKILDGYRTTGEIPPGCVIQRGTKLTIR